MTHYSYLKARHDMIAKAVAEVRDAGMGDAVVGVYEFELEVVKDLLANERVRKERDAEYVLCELIAHPETVTPIIAGLLALIPCATAPSEGTHANHPDHAAV